LLGVSKQFGVARDIAESAAQVGEALRRQVGRRDQRTAEPKPRKQQLDKLPVVVLVDVIEHSRDVRQLVVFLQGHLDEQFHLALGDLVLEKRDRRRRRDARRIIVLVEGAAEVKRLAVEEELAVASRDAAETECVGDRVDQRSANPKFRPQPVDPYVPADVIKRMQLRPGLMLSVNTGPNKRGPGPLVTYVNQVEGKPLREFHHTPFFQDLTVIDPRERLKLETPGGPVRILPGVEPLSLTPGAPDDRCVRPLPLACAAPEAPFA